MTTRSVDSKKRTRASGEGFARVTLPGGAPSSPSPYASHDASSSPDLLPSSDLSLMSAAKMRRVKAEELNLPPPPGIRSTLVHAPAIHLLPTLARTVRDRIRRWSIPPASAISLDPWTSSWHEMEAKLGWSVRAITYRWDSFLRLRFRGEPLADAVLPTFAALPSPTPLIARPWAKIEDTLLYNLMQRPCPTLEVDWAEIGSHFGGTRTTLEVMERWYAWADERTRVVDEAQSRWTESFMDEYYYNTVLRTTKEWQPYELNRLKFLIKKSDTLAQITRMLPEKSRTMVKKKMERLKEEEEEAQDVLWDE
ncbi:hypothetical protein MNV49_004699 [Pseudohyphozyma bogoriensis]|nr:hypothetical protein MNV49_004699 [Pseudohyphozyma bogoriensis]